MILTNTDMWPDELTHPPANIYFLDAVNLGLILDIQRQVVAVLLRAIGDTHATD